MGEEKTTGILEWKCWRATCGGEEMGEQGIKWIEFPVLPQPATSGIKQK